MYYLLKKKKNLPLSAYNPYNLCNLSIASLSQFLPSFLSSKPVFIIQQLKLASTQSPRRWQEEVCSPSETEVLNLNFMDGGRLWLGKTDDFLQHSRAIEIHSPLPLVFFSFPASTLQSSPLNGQKTLQLFWLSQSFSGYCAASCFPREWISIRHGTTKERGRQLGVVHLVAMSKQMGLTVSNLHPSYIGTKKYSMLLLAPPSPLKHDTLLPKPAVCCS